MRTVLVVGASWLGVSIGATAVISFVSTRLRDGENTVELKPVHYEEELAS